MKLTIRTKPLAPNAAMEGTAAITEENNASTQETSAFTLEDEAGSSNGAALTPVSGQRSPPAPMTTGNGVGRPGEAVQAKDHHAGGWDCTSSPPKFWSPQHGTAGSRRIHRARYHC